MVVVTLDVGPQIQLMMTLSAAFCTSGSMSTSPSARPSRILMAGVVVFSGSETVSHNCNCVLGVTDAMARTSNALLMVSALKKQVNMYLFYVFALGYHHFL